jgi:hypothetical protein
VGEEANKMNNYYYGPIGNQGYQDQEINDYRNIMNTCQRYMNYHVVGQMSDGTQMNGILQDMDDEGVTMLVPEDVDDDSDDMRFGGYGGYGRRRFRRFRRRRFPYNVFVFPFFFPFPYFY